MGETKTEAQFVTSLLLTELMTRRTNVNRNIKKTEACN